MTDRQVHIKPLEPALEDSIRERVLKIPIMETLNISIEKMGEGFCSIKVPYKQKYDGIFECFHGGLLMTAADTVACFSVMTITGAQQMMSTTDMNIRFLAPCTTDLTAEAKIIKVGKTLCPVEINLYDETRKHIAVAQVNYMRLPGLTGKR